MLPITRQRSFHVPHSLATAAAIIALVTALGWEASDGNTSGIETADSALDQVASVNKPRDSNPPGGSSAPAGAGSTGDEPGVLSGLLPLVLPNISGP